MKQYDVLASGYVSMDRIIRVLSPLRVGFTSLAENADNAKTYYGGCSMNIAYELARLGMKAVPHIRVGKDWREIGFYDYLHKGGACMGAIVEVPDETTSNCYLLEDAEKDHVTVFYPGTMHVKYAEPMEDHQFQESRLGVMTVGSYPDNLEFLERCEENGLPLVSGMKSGFDAFPPGFLRRVLRYSRVIFANNAERETIERLCSMCSITELFEQGNTDVIVITLDSRDSICYRKTPEGYDMAEMRIARYEHVIDATGSGDAYLSGFLYGYLNGYELVECCNPGSILSSFMVEEMGCSTNAPDLQQLLQRYREFQQRQR